MREDLLGYLLGALEPDEMERVERALREDPALRGELDRLQAALRPLEEDDEIFEPPADLLARTWQSIDRAEAAQEPAVDRFGGGPAGGVPNGRGVPGAAQLSPSAGASPSRQWRFGDFVATTIAALVMAGLVLPGILRGRFEARREGCQANLRHAGVALSMFALRQPDCRMPRLEIFGPEAFAGMYRVRLRDAELMGPSPFWCPSRDVPEYWMGRPAPSSDEVREASPQHLVVLQEGAGGHYAYNLGYYERGRYEAPRYEGRSDYPILADAPVPSLGGWTIGHAGKGFNLLYEDGRVRFFAVGATATFADDPFLNRRGAIEAGVDANDASLGASALPPIQRPILIRHDQ